MNKIARIQTSKLKSTQMTKARASRGSDSAAMVAAMKRSQAVIEFDLDGTILDANENFLSAMGYDLSEIKGRHHSIFVDPSYRDSREYREFWRRLGEGEFQANEFKRFGKGGREIWIQASYNPLMRPNGSVYKVVKFAVDITSAKLKSIQDSARIAAIDRTQAVISFELDGTIIDANQNFLSTMGYRLDEIRGKRHGMFVDPTYRESSEYRDFWAKLNKGEYASGTFKRFGKGGKEIWIQGSYNPIFDNDGRPVSVVKFANNITDSVELANQIKVIVEAVSAASTELQASAETLDSNAKESKELATTVASASGQLSAAILEISRQIVKTQEVSGYALEESNKAKQEVSGLSDATAKISNVVELINEIAEQTNLLALNATIEAARAGEAGKGFAVVASEVKTLANQTAKATQEISAQIEGIQKATGSVVSANTSIGTTIADISSMASSVSAAVEEQSSATQNVASNISSVSESTIEAERITEDVGKAASELAEFATKLNSQVGEYLRKLGVLS